MTDPDYRDAQKRWRRRNSDFLDTWERERSASPPARAIVESALPPGTYLETPEEPAGVSERHVHTWGVDEP